MTDYDQRDEIYRRQDREDELNRVSKAVTDLDPQDIISMRVSLSCASGEAINTLITFCLANKDRWGEYESDFKRLSWSVDKTKEFLSEAKDLFANEGPRITSVEWRCNDGPTQDT